MAYGTQLLPDGMARQFADRAAKMDGCVRTGSCFEFAQGNQVVCLVMLDPPMGHVSKNPRRAEEIRAALSTTTPA